MGALPEVQVLPRADHSERSEAQLHEGAGEDVADKSVQFLEKVIFKKSLPEFHGVRRLIVVNQFAYIQTNDFEGLLHQIGELNDAAITAALHESDIVVLA